MRKLLVAAFLFLAACHRSEPTVATPTPSGQQERAERAEQLPESKQQHWAFLDRIRQSEDLSSSIQHTLQNDQNQLGVVLYSSVTPEKILAVMRAVMTRMVQKFPGEDVTLAVYAAGSPPRRIGTAHLDGKTGNTTYTPTK